MCALNPFGDPSPFENSSETGNWEILKTERLSTLVKACVKAPMPNSKSREGKKKKSKLFDRLAFLDTENVTDSALIARIKATNGSQRPGLDLKVFVNRSKTGGHTLPSKLFEN